MAKPHETHEGDKTPKPKGFLKKTFSSVSSSISQKVKGLRQPFRDKAFMDAVSSGYPARVRKALRDGANPQTQDNAGLLLAAANGYSDVIMVLLQAGVKADAEGSDALVKAISGGHRDTVKLLLQHGADIHAKDDEAMIRGASLNNVRMLDLLIASGADVNAREGAPLRLAAQKGREHVVEKLLSAGATVHKDHPALALARHGGFQKCVDLILVAIERQNKPTRNPPRVSGP